MKKINLFNKTISPLSDGKGCPVERGGVWELPRRTPCATPSWKEGEHKVPSYRRRPVSGGIVENRHTAEARCPGIAIAMTCPAGDFSSQGDEKHNVCDAVTAPAIRRAGWIPAFAGMTAIVIAVTLATPSFAEPTELDKKTVASKAYVDTKQDIIQTGNILFYDNVGTENDLYVPGLVAYDSSSQTLKGNKIGILDYETIADGEGSLGAYSDVNYENGEMDNFVPTVRAVANDLENIWNNMPYWSALTWDSAETTSTNAYEIKFVGDTGATANAWPSADKTKLVNTAAFAQGLALKQNKLPRQTTTTNYVPKGGQTITLATTADGAPGTRYITAGGSVGLTTKSDAPAVIGYVNGTVALAPFSSGTFGAAHQVADSRHIKNALVSLELLKDVYSELNSKITNNALPTGTTGTVVTYNGVNAETGVQEFGERAVYDPANTYNASTDATKLATMASVKYECAGYEPAAAGQPAHDGTHPGDEDYCWLWTLPN